MEDITLTAIIGRSDKQCVLIGVRESTDTVWEIGIWNNVFSYFHFDHGRLNLYGEDQKIVGEIPFVDDIDVQEE